MALAEQQWKVVDHKLLAGGGGRAHHADASVVCAHSMKPVKNLSARMQR
jgi:hypothetical protein